MPTASIDAPRFRWYLSIAVDLSVGQRSRAERTMRRALASGVVRAADIAEVILHLALLCGVPTTLDGLERLHVVAGRLPLRRDRPSLARGRRAFRRIYGAQANAVLARLRSLDPFLERWVLRDAYGTIFSRHGLELQERTLLTGLILAMQGLDRQMASHIRGTLRLGVTCPEVLRWIRAAERRSGGTLANARASLERFAH
ncbi:MAG: hypothetical protein MUE68_00750 [Bacteroidetes bacterium]|jgi:alkylhydroperoxidase/carboxymuconolactone decarboxylase family protein YurZ|nr:hypothetical protein [Bacteroidota bacterium]